MTSVICQEFHCTPEEADRQDVARCMHIMQLRSFAHSWHEIESGVTQENLTKTQMLKKVVEIQVKRAKGELD